MPNFPARALRATRRRLTQPRPGLIAHPTAGGPPFGDAAFDPDRAWELLVRQCRSGPRCPAGEGRAPTRRLILDRLTACADEVAVQEWQQRVDRGVGSVGRYPMTNVLARFGPATEQLDLLLATHWDTRPLADEDPDAARRGEPPSGANDGGSGVAVLLELARSLRVERPPRAVGLAFLDGEDLGAHCYGSRVLARSLQRRAGRRWRARRAIVVDMIGGAGLRCTTERNSMDGAPDLWRQVHGRAAELGLEQHFHGPEKRITDDHVHLGRIGMPSVLLIDFAYPYRHTTGDTVDRCSPGSLAAIGVLLQSLVRR
jgi:glutaminyl-peptide cyclotransferase